jgi:hypothetical protein
MSKKTSRLREFLMATALLAPTTLAFAQEPTDSGQNPSTGPGQDTAASDITQGQPNAAATTQGLFARALNSASPLSGENGPLQWGALSVRSLSFQQYYSQASLQTPGTPTQTASLDISQVSTDIVVSHAFGASHSTQFSLQYTPSLFLTEGHIYTNALNQTAGVDMIFQLDPRLSLQFSDRFNYYGRQRSFSGLSLDANYSLGTVAQNNFLDGPARVIYNAFGATFTHLWSPVTTVSFTPTLGYQDSTGAVSAIQNVSAFGSGGQLIVSHQLSATQTVGISYTGVHLSYSNSSTTAGPQANGWQQDLLLNYSQQLAATWRLSVGLGLTDDTGINSQSGLAANAGITKSFQRMDFAVNYYRGHQFNGYITNQSSDRIDLLHTVRWTPRFATTTSLAYFRTTNSSNSATSGEYATEQVSYGLTRSLSLTAGFAYTKQTGDGVYLLSGNRKLASVGITWAPPAPTQSPSPY